MVKLFKNLNNKEIHPALNLKASSCVIILEWSKLPQNLQFLKFDKFWIDPKKFVREAHKNSQMEKTPKPQRFVSFSFHKSYYCYFVTTLMNTNLKVFTCAKLPNMGRFYVFFLSLHLLSEQIHRNYIKLISVVIHALCWYLESHYMWPILNGNCIK